MTIEVSINQSSACITEHYYINFLGSLWRYIHFYLGTLHVCIYIIDEYRDRYCTSRISSSINIVMCEMIESCTSYQNRNYQQVYTNLCLSGTVNESQVFKTSCTS